ncbi:unnamed protein product [Aspergillus oryzae]|uniref:RING-type E3 ubiquitin transferase n=2 Tax=Aspergillus oryzae TaxID=5062 RepID=A0AAN5BXW2_ASPOZ|nr:unnamed protein product [Aspergillus oryzae]GMF87184.1 unnamed protein product [Aspergillus oryzae]GMG16306.1 unnamed protein product [Aspergillus oryzae]GMG38222.1 unnamed protein product [Aspergillus oryzae]GMG45485.1 unnamed protein product [Aspergillus oryzae var. brunneus]
MTAADRNVTSANDPPTATMDRPWRTPMNDTWEKSTIAGPSEAPQTPDNVDLQQEIMQKTLEEVAQEEADGSVANPCVICLELISEPAVALPCRHANYDFLCLLSWLENRRICPLCMILLQELQGSVLIRSLGKSDVSAVEYELDNPEGLKVHRLEAPSEALPTHTTPLSRRNCIYRRPRRPRPHVQHQNPPSREDEVSRRQHVYRHQLYSLRVGSNRLSQYQELTPDKFKNDEGLVSRARTWIRRELQVFDFLHRTEAGSSQSSVARPGQARLESRRGSNAEFLLEYIIAILRTVDIKGSAGQAESLLQDFLGRDNARLFLHELQAWLRSPYTSLSDWDRNVQYDDPSRRSASFRSRPEPRPSDRTTTPVYRNNDRVVHGRVSRPPPPRRPQHGERSRDAMAQARRIQYARGRYVPD